jgi:ATP-dependent Clp protease ATP-binding subunit ClpC
VDAANIIKPALARGELQVIGATTISEYRRHIEKDAALERRFQAVIVGEPSSEDALDILRGLREKYETHHKLKISDEALRAAVELSVRYIADRYLPDKAIDLIDEAASRLRIRAHTSPDNIKVKEEELKTVSREKETAILAQEFERAAALRDKEQALKKEIDEEKSHWRTSQDAMELSVSERDIAEVVTQWTGIPVHNLLTEEEERLLRLEEHLHARVIGQTDAVAAVAKAIRRGRIGLKDPRRPIGSFIFMGPTGIGKTELAKALAEVMFGSEGAMIRLDMSEYMEKHSVSKLIGSPPGYVGFDEGGQLTEKIRRKPYSVVLFDEIEKAHPDVFNILLQVLEDGHLTDSQGRQVDFRNTVIILTSNVGAGELSATKTLGFVLDAPESEDAERRERMMRALRSTFRPEFLNRIDEVIIFNSLSKEDIAEIARLMLDDVAKRCREIGISLSFSPAVAELLAERGFDANWGARPLRRTVMRLVEDRLSTDLLEGKFAAGDKVKADVKDGEIVFEKK